jgi:hypothetical protein
MLAVQTDAWSSRSQPIEQVGESLLFRMETVTGRIDAVVDSHRGLMKHVLFDHARGCGNWDDVPLHPPDPLFLEHRGVVTGTGKEERRGVSRGTCPDDGRLRNSCPSALPIPCGTRQSRFQGDLLISRICTDLHCHSGCSGSGTGDRTATRSCRKGLVCVQVRASAYRPSPQSAVLGDRL